MKSPTHHVTLVALLSIIGVASPLSALADDDKPGAGHAAFIKGLREMDKTELVAEVEVESASKPRSLSPVVSRFKGWFIDVTEKAKEAKLEGVADRRRNSQPPRGASIPRTRLLYMEPGDVPYPAPHAALSVRGDRVRARKAA